MSSRFAIGSCRDDTDDFPANADDYELVEEIGVGATARVCYHLLLYLKIEIIGLI